MGDQHKNTVICPKCGTSFPVPSPLRKSVSCPHCHKKLVLSFASERHLRYMRYFIVFVIACFFGWGIWMINVRENYFPLLITAVLSLWFSYVSDQFSLWALYRMKGLAYSAREEYEAERNRQKAKNRRFMNRKED